MELDSPVVVVAVVTLLDDSMEDSVGVASDSDSNSDLCSWSCWVGSSCSRFLFVVSTSLLEPIFGLLWLLSFFLLGDEDEDDDAVQWNSVLCFSVRLLFIADIFSFLLALGDFRRFDSFLESFNGLTERIITYRKQSRHLKKKKQMLHFMLITSCC